MIEATLLYQFPNGSRRVKSYLLEPAVEFLERMFIADYRSDPDAGSISAFGGTKLELDRVDWVKDIATG